MSRTTALSLEEINQKREALALLSKEQLEKMSRDGLREACAGILKVSPKDLKATLIEKILEFTEPLRLEKIAAYQLLKEEISTYSLNDSEIEQIVKNTSPEIAARLIQDIMLNSYTVKSRVKTVLPKIIKFVAGLQDEKYTEEFSKLIRSFNSEDSKTIRREYTQQVAEFNKNQMIVDFDTVINWAEKQLVDRRDWKSVSAALSITSGRRMVEIHSTGSFEVTTKPNDLPEFPHARGYLDFSGQAKERQNMTTKESKESYIIPILVDPILWITAYNWLCGEGKCGITPTEVNKNISANITRKDSIGLKKLFNPNKITKTVKRRVNGVSTEVEVEVGDYKTCRDFYAAVFRKDFRTIEVNYSEAVMLCRLLGHGESDLSTQHSYAKLSIQF